MVNWEWIEKLFDKYSRVARLYPALITLGPVIWSAVALFPSLIDSALHSALFVIAAACLLYFISSVARSRGKRTEARLLAKWGGWPTTIMLRHRDAAIDPITKHRYRTALLKLSSGMMLPTQEDEAQSPDDADNYYRSATKILIEHRREDKYDLVHTENASYGFRRNLFGLKPIGVVIATTAAVLTAIAWWLVTPEPIDWRGVALTTIQYPHFPLLFVLDVGYVALWLWAVSERFVREAADEYAYALLRTLDQPTP